ncbi:MAG: acetylxylan esterase [Bacteroidales bacterium]
MRKQRYILLAILPTFFVISCNRTNEIIYNESDVPNYKLPELMISEEGRVISDKQDWTAVRKSEILEQFANEVYGHIPDLAYAIRFRERIIADNYLDGAATIREIEAEVSSINGADKFTILYVHPTGKRNIPVFVGLNFRGNHTVDTLTEITIHDRWVPNNEKLKITDHLSTPESRGTKSSRWPLASIIGNGYGVATVYCGEFDPDYDDGYMNGFHPVFAPAGKQRNNQSPGTISIWAKGMSLMADFLIQDSIADPSRLIAIGHSRLGKTALWCGVNDERFSAVISNSSGCGGAALSMRSFGETVERINEVFPHWFSGSFKNYNGRENKLPVDQHMLLALVAPRPVYVASATDDQWADPLGEFLALKEAVPVYELFGYAKEFPLSQPLPDKPYHGITGYHLRSGSHDITEYDWIQYISWCNKWLGN